MVVPVSFVFPITGSRPSTSSTTGFPYAYLSWWISPPLLTITVNCVDNAFTTEDPTPCSPPLVLYALLSNFPPAWSVVNTTRSALTPFWCIPTGMPRPLSEMVAEPSASSVTRISLHSPARCSSTELSTISYIKWFKPFVETLPIYIPGRFLTASSPSKTVMLDASYVVLSVFVILGTMPF